MSFKPSSLFCLNIAQFQTALTDNFYKFLIAYLLIDLKGPSQSSWILALLGALFVIPFLFFSLPAGVIADKKSKRSLIVYLKGAEIIIMLYSLIAVYYRSERDLYISFFLLALEGALMSPAKWGIIPEIVPISSISKANGLISFFLYLAIILGTALPSILLEMTHRNYLVGSGFCFILSCFGFLFSLGIQRTRPIASHKKGHFFFPIDLKHSLEVAHRRPHLLLAIFMSSLFFFVAAFLQMNIIPFTLESLHLSDLAGGYLFLWVSLGLGVGSFLSGFLSGKKVELGLPQWGQWGLSLFMILLGIFNASLPISLVLLMALGLLGGAVTVPTAAYLQSYSPQEERSQLIATNNFFNFLGVLVASILLSLFSQKFHIQASLGFLIVGLLYFMLSFLSFFPLSDQVLRFLWTWPLRFHTKFQIDEELLDRPKKTIWIQKGSKNEFLLSLIVFPEAIFITESPPQWGSLLKILEKSPHLPGTQEVYWTKTPPSDPHMPLQWSCDGSKNRLQKL